MKSTRYCKCIMLKPHPDQLRLSHPTPNIPCSKVEVKQNKMKYRFVTNERNEINKRNEKTQNKNKIEKFYSVLLQDVESLY